MDITTKLKRSIKVEHALRYGSVKSLVKDLVKECRTGEEFQDSLEPYMDNSEVKQAVEDIYDEFTGFEDTDLRVLYEIIKANGGETL